MREHVEGILSPYKFSVNKRLPGESTFARNLNRDQRLLNSGEITRNERKIIGGRVKAGA